MITARRHIRSFITALLMMWFLVMATTSAAQGGSGTTTTSGTTIHVVQRNENLFRIAMRYGTTVEAIAAANGITDPRYISVGQRLLIPNASENTPGTLVTYRVQPGDTLDTIALRHQTTAENIASANHVTNPHQLFIGQELTIGHGASEGEDPTIQAIHRVQPGENVLRVALRYHIPWITLAQANGQAAILPLFAGQRLRIPGHSDDARLLDLPEPLTSFTLTPSPAIQGKTLSLHLTTRGPASLTGTFIGYPVQFVTHDSNQHNALFGIHAFTDAGIYPLELTITGPEGQRTTLLFKVRIDEGGYGTETISLDTQQQDLLNPQVTEPEWELIARTMSTFTAQRYFDGLMGLPSTGAITSRFGTRRAYNGGALSTFHSGTDFGGAPGSSIVAPAAGVVILAESLPVRGNATVIDHGWGVTTGYWHQAEILVNVGDVVTPGQVIGTVGSTGRSTGPHLHWEMWVSGVQVDPMQWVQQPFP